MGHQALRQTRTRGMARRRAVGHGARCTAMSGQRDHCGHCEPASGPPRAEPLRGDEGRGRLRGTRLSEPECSPFLLLIVVSRSLLLQITIQGLQRAFDDHPSVSLTRVFAPAAYDGLNDEDWDLVRVQLRSYK